MNCFSCGAQTELPPGARIGFRDECERCACDLHVCRNCSFYDPSAYNECREPNAERILERDRANRCDYFSPGEGGEGSKTERQGESRTQLDALFKK